LTALTICLGLSIEGLTSFVDLAAKSLMDPSIYIKAVFGDGLIP